MIEAATIAENRDTSPGNALRAVGLVVAVAAGGLAVAAVAAVARRPATTVTRKGTFLETALRKAVAAAEAAAAAIAIIAVNLVTSRAIARLPAKHGAAAAAVAAIATTAVNRVTFHASAPRRGVAAVAAMVAAAEAVVTCSATSARVMVTWPETARLRPRP